MSSVLDWIDDPVTIHGIHFAELNGGWRFQSYDQVALDAGRIAALLVESGGRPGDVVCLLVAETENFVPAFLGATLAGMTPSPIASPFAFQGHYAAHVTELVAAARPALILAEPFLAHIADQAVQASGHGRTVRLGQIADLPVWSGGRAPAPEIALLQFTSGSSGTPKGVRVTSENLDANVAAIHDWLGVTPDDSCASWLPLYHDMGLIGSFLGTVVAQVDLWLMSPVDFVRTPLRWLDCHGRRGATISTAPNFGYAYTTKRIAPADLDGMDFSRWRIAMNGAERIAPAVAADFADLLAPFGFHPRAFTPCYGLAESTLAVTGTTPGRGARIVQLGAQLRTGGPVTVVDQATLGVDRPAEGGRWLAGCGTPVDGAVVQVVDDEGTALPDGHFGEIRIQGTSLALGYQTTTGPADPAPELSTFPSTGLRTGDSGFLLDGELFVVGRLGDSLKIRGRKVHAEDLEDALTGIPGVPTGRCVVALANSEQEPCAVLVVETRTRLWLDSALTVLRSVLGEDVAVTIVIAKRGTIPRTSSGKPRRRLVWQLFQQQELTGEVIHTSHYRRRAA